MYQQRIYRAGKTVAVHKTYSKKHDPGFRREKGAGYTPDAMAEYNRKIQEREVANLAHKNLRPGKDIHLNFTYRQDNRPPPEQAKRDLNRAVDIMRREMQKRGLEFKFIKAMGVGVRGGLHLHVMTNCTDPEILSKAWPYGGIYTEPLFKNGNFAPLAAYFVGQKKEAGKAEIKIIGRWSCSRNMVRVDPLVKNIARFSWREPPEAPKGYMIDVDSIDAGENPVTGIPYLFYRMLEIPPLRNPMSRKAWEEHETEERKKNRKAVRDAWAKEYGCCGIQKAAGRWKKPKPPEPVARQKK